MLQVVARAEVFVLLVFLIEVLGKDLVIRRPGGPGLCGGLGFERVRGPFGEVLFGVFEAVFVHFDGVKAVFFRVREVTFRVSQIAVGVAEEFHRAFEALRGACGVGGCFEVLGDGESFHGGGDGGREFRHPGDGFKPMAKLGHRAKKTPPGRPAAFGLMKGVGSYFFFLVSPGRYSSSATSKAWARPTMSSPGRRVSIVSASRLMASWS